MRDLFNSLFSPFQPLYRCWNQNSHDTGGIVGNNWLDIMWNKISWLEKATGLSPWWRKAAINAGVTSNPAPPKIVPMPTQSKGVQPYCSDVQPAPQYSCPQHMAWGEDEERRKRQFFSFSFWGFPFFEISLLLFLGSRVPLLPLTRARARPLPRILRSLLFLSKEEASAPRLLRALALFLDVAGGSRTKTLLTFLFFSLSPKKQTPRTTNTRRLLQIARPPLREMLLQLHLRGLRDVLQRPSSELERFCHLRCRRRRRGLLLDHIVVRPLVRQVLQRCGPYRHP